MFYHLEGTAAPRRRHVADLWSQKLVWVVKQIVAIRFRAFPSSSLKNVNVIIALQLSLQLIHVPSILNDWGTALVSCKNCSTNWSEVLGNICPWLSENVWSCVMWDVSFVSGLICPQSPSVKGLNAMVTDQLLVFSHKLNIHDSKIVKLITRMTFELWH